MVLEKKQFVEEKTQEAEKILNEAKPQLKIASEALNTLNRNVEIIIIYIIIPYLYIY